MADRPNRPQIKYVYGELTEANEEQRWRDAMTRERHGVTQIERVMRGEEKPADLAADIAHLRKIGVLAPEAEAALGGMAGLSFGACVEIAAQLQGQKDDLRAFYGAD
jgi:hypothetical protein